MLYHGMILSNNSDKYIQKVLQSVKTIALVGASSNPERDLTNKVMYLANKIASKSTMTVTMGKKAFYAQKELDLSKAYEHTSKVMVINLLKDDAIEGINAFFEKRPPKWKK